VKINYVQGDLFKYLPDPDKGKTIFIPHVCNTLGCFGAGFVIPLMKHFPGVNVDYASYCNKWKDESLGYVDYFRTLVNDDSLITRVVCNMIAQKGVIGKNNAKPIKYVALMNCMVEVQNMVLSYIKDGAKAEIYCPKFGSALAGGNWDLIEELINEIWIENKIKVTVFYL